MRMPITMMKIVGHYRIVVKALKEFIFQRLKMRGNPVVNACTNRNQQLYYYLQQKCCHQYSQESK